MRFLTTFLIAVLVINTQAQTTRGAFIGNGLVQFTAFPDDSDRELSYYVLPTVQYFLSPRINVGGSVLLTGNERESIQTLEIAPQLQFILDPRHPQNNWFLFFNPHFTLVLDQDSPIIPYSELNTGLGLYTFLSPNVLLQSKLSIIFGDRYTKEIFQIPTYQLSTGLSWYLAPQLAFGIEKDVPRIGKGSWMVGGIDPQIDLRPGKSTSNFKIALTPQIGYFFSDHFVFGIGLPFAHNYQSFQLEDRTKLFYKYTVIGIIPYFRYYAGQPEQEIRFFAETSTRLAAEKRRSSSQINPILNEAGGIFTINTGINYFVRSTLALEGSLFYENYFLSGSNFFGLKWGFQFFLNGPGH